MVWEHKGEHYTPRMEARSLDEGVRYLESRLQVWEGGLGQEQRLCLTQRGMKDGPDREGIN